MLRYKLNDAAATNLVKIDEKCAEPTQLWLFFPPDPRNTPTPSPIPTPIFSGHFPLVIPKAGVYYRVLT
jgi:hypothetical protein